MAKMVSMLLPAGTEGLKAKQIYLLKDMHRVSSMSLTTNDTRNIEKGLHHLIVDSLGSMTSGCRGATLIGGDANAKAGMWGTFQLIRM